MLLGPSRNVDLRALFEPCGLQLLNVSVEPIIHPNSNAYLEGGKPHEPVKTVVVRRYDARPSAYVTCVENTPFRTP